jgi:hypothetical protein
MKIAVQRICEYECTADDYDFAIAFMVKRRFNGNRKGNRQRHPAPTQRLPKNPRPPKRKVRLALENELGRQSSAMANIAADIDQNDNKLIYQTTKKDGPDGEIWGMAVGKNIIKLIQLKTMQWIRYKDIPPGRKAAYYNPCCRKMNQLEHRVRCTIIGGDQLNFDGEAAASEPP